MQADDLVNLVAGRAGRRRGGFSVRHAGSMVAKWFATSKYGRSSRKFFLGGSDDEPEPRVAEEVREDPDDDDNESTSADAKAGRRCCCCCSTEVLRGYSIHLLFFLFTVAVTLNWSATSYAVGRKVCLAWNDSNSTPSPHPPVPAGEFCQRWLIPYNNTNNNNDNNNNDNSNNNNTNNNDKNNNNNGDHSKLTPWSEPRSVRQVIGELFGWYRKQRADRGGGGDHPTSDDLTINKESRSPLSSPVDAGSPWTRRHGGGGGKKRRGDEAEETAQLYAVYQAIVALVPPALVLIVIVLSYKDNMLNLRTPLFVGLAGTALSTAANLASSRFPHAPLYVDVLTPLGEMATGGLPLVLMCVYVHVAAAGGTTSKGRTTAFFLLQVVFLLGFAAARLVAALVVDAWTLTLPLFVASLVVLFVAVVVMAVVVERIDLEAEVDDEDQRGGRGGRRRRRGHHYHHEAGQTSGQTTGNNRQAPGSTSADPVLLSTRLFSHHHLLASVRGLVSERARGTKYELMFLMATIFFLVATTNGSVAGFFLENAAQEGSRVVLDSIVIIATVLVVLPLFVVIVRSLPMDPNYTVTLIGVLFLAAGQSLHLASLGGGRNSAAINHIQHVLRTVSNLAPAGVRAHVATLVERRELAKVFGTLAACEALAPLIGAAVRRIVGHSVGQLPLLVLLCAPMVMLGVGQCRSRRPQLAVAVREDDE